MGKRITCAVLAHVDAGKTTLSENILYNAGAIKAAGRVDYKDAYLDTDSMEKKRGITIYSKQAVFNYGESSVYLIDTPGHVDFATETERALAIVDYAILLISGADGVQGHTKTLWKLLGEYNIPTFIFVNKMDQDVADKTSLLADIQKKLTDGCFELSDVESIAMTSEVAMEEFLSTDDLSRDTIATLIANRQYFPVLFGSALKNTGVVELMEAIDKYSLEPDYHEDTSLRVYKIEKLGLDHRLTDVKVTGGILKVKDILPNGEKINQIRIYSGSKYRQVDELLPGQVGSLIGPEKTYAGQGMGQECDLSDVYLSPVLRYAVHFLDDTDPAKAYQMLLALSEEDPSVDVSFNDTTSEISMSLMGQVQTEILAERIEILLGYKIIFEEGRILYKETIANCVEGVGHFEPLRHYAEAHILMEPAERGTGISVEADVCVDELDLNWQRLIETHIYETEHVGVLTGSPITDIHFTICGGKAHLKHTEGGDFREATYRAVRQGLMEAENVLLEPYYRFELVVPTGDIGRAMNDIESMHGFFNSPVIEEDFATIIGVCPVATIQNYQANVASYTKGMGQLGLEYAGYDACHNPEEIISRYNYNPDSDTMHPCGSVFCSHGAGVYVPWNQVKDSCHVPCRFSKNEPEYVISDDYSMRHGSDEVIDSDEIDKILYRATHSNFGKNPKKGWNRNNSRPKRTTQDYVYREPKKTKVKDKYLLVDGYNLIYAWPELRDILEDNLDGARGRLLDILCNYQAIKNYNVIAVFDAYKLKNHPVECSDYLNIHQVFTAEAQTADAYIEKFTHDHSKNYDITVVTSDGLEQVIIRGEGAHLISSREFIDDVDRASKELKEKFDIK
ncbi:MAG: NYN domain-containing protein [Pseudobutyrivibrio sp.]|nr:NYN domain-containing protein [Pseudobutyrivibrio sp.]